MKILFTEYSDIIYEEITEAHILTQELFAILSAFVFIHCRYIFTVANLHYKRIFWNQ